MKRDNCPNCGFQDEKDKESNDIYGDCSFGRFNTPVAFWSYMVRSPIQSYVLVLP